MGTARRKFSLEFKTEPAHRVIDTGRSVVEVAGELSVDKGSLARWARDERRRVETVAGSSDEPEGCNLSIRRVGREDPIIQEFPVRLGPAKSAII